MPGLHNLIRQIQPQNSRESSATHECKVELYYAAHKNVEDKNIYIYIEREREREREREQ